MRCATDMLYSSARSSSPAQYSNRSPRRYSARVCIAGARRKSKKACVVCGSPDCRWMSETKSATVSGCALADAVSDAGCDCMRAGASDDFRFFDHDIFDRDVRMHAGAGSLDRLDLVDDFLAFHDLAEDTVAPAILARVIEEAVVLHIDEELRRRGMRVRCARHRDTVRLVLQSVLRFVFDRFIGWFLLHAGFEAAALDHEAVDDAMEDRAVVVAGAHVVQKILDRFRRFFRIEIEFERAVVGGEEDSHDVPSSEVVIVYLMTAADSITTGLAGTF